MAEDTPWEKRTVLMPRYARAQAEARYWREACLRQAHLAKEVVEKCGASNNREYVLGLFASTLGRIAEGPQRPAQGITALSYVQDEALAPVLENLDNIPKRGAA